MSSASWCAVLWTAPLTRIEKRRARDKLYYERNRPRILARRAERSAEYNAARRARWPVYYAKMKSQINERRRDWRSRPERREIDRRRRREKWPIEAVLYAEHIRQYRKTRWKEKRR